GPTVRFSLLQHLGESVNNSTFRVAAIEEGVADETVWCLEVEEEQAFVLPSGIVTGNCAYHPIEDLFALPELLYNLMQGCGNAFSCEDDYVSELPRVKKQRAGAVETMVVPDSTEGWCATYHTALQRWWDGHDVGLRHQRRARRRHAAPHQRRQ